MTPRTSDGYPLTELARAIDAQLQGQADLRITGVNSLEQAAPGDLALLVSHRLMEQSRTIECLGFHRPPILS